MADDKQKFVEQIRRLIPINELPAQVQNEVAKNAEFLKIRKGGYVFKQGDRDDFSYYLIEGEIELHSGGALHSTINGGTDRARYAMAQLQPRQFSARASVPSIVMKVRRDYLDKLLVMQDKDGPDKTDITNYDLATAEVEVVELEQEDDVDWMTRMLQSELFSRMPTANIQTLFAMLEPVELNAGDVVIKQGDPGEDYYIIQSGRCQVLRAPSPGGKEIKLAELKAGDSFGEEALIADTTRNATISMLTPGVLMRLSKDNFIELVKKPTLRAVSLAEAKKLVAGGAKWLDVRYKNEHDEAAIPGSQNIPLNILRMQVDKLDPDASYVVYCDTSGRSSTAAFLLAERGFQVSYLQGGLVNNPDAVPAQPEKSAAAPPPAAPESEAPAPEARPAAAAPSVKAEQAEETEEEMDPEVKASVLEADLARTDMQLKNVEKNRQGLTDEAQKAAQVEVERRLREERAKIEAAKKEAEAEAIRIRKAEEQKLERMKAEAEKRLQEEKRKIEEVYSRNAEEMEKLQRMKQEAEEQMKRERERLEKEALSARSQLDEANKIKKQLQAARKAMEKEEQRRLKEQQALELKIQEKAREKLEAERRKLAEQFALNNEELETARRERAEADAAREAAKAEAARIIEEYKSKHEEARAEEEARLRAERQKLEEEQKKIQETLKQIQQARQEAEAARRKAEQEVATLRAREKDREITESKVARNTLQDEIRQAEKKLSEAKQGVARAQEDQKKAEHAERVNRDNIVQRVEMEESMRQQLEADLAEFKGEMEEKEKQFASMASQMDHMRRIKSQAEAAKAAAKAANQDLLADVAAQLGRGDD